MTALASCPEDDAGAEAWLKARIEALSAQYPMWSKTAYTHRMTPHRQFLNGRAHEEGEEAVPPAGSVKEAAEQTLSAVMSYRETIPGPVVLVWRIEPVVERRDRKSDKDPSPFSLYVRLCFETDPKDGMAA